MPKLKWIRKSFLKLYHQHAKNQFVQSVHSSDRVNFRARDHTCNTRFWPCPPKKSQKFGRIWENQLAKNQLIPLIHSWDTVNFRLPQADWTYLFLTMPYQKNFYQLSIFANLYQHAKNGAVSSICSGEIVDLKIFQSSWLIAFWPIPQEQNFPQNGFCAGTHQIAQIFIREKIKWRLMTKFFFNLKKTLFLAHFPIFRGKKSFTKKSSSGT